MNYTLIEDIAEFEDVANAVWYFATDASRGMIRIYEYNR